MRFLRGRWKKDRGDEDQKVERNFGRIQATKDEPVTDKRSDQDNGGCFGHRARTLMLNFEVDKEGSSSQFHLNYSKRDRIAYLVDRILAKRWRFFVLLGFWGLLQVFISGGLYAIVWSGELSDDDPREDIDINDWAFRITESLWEAWTFMADPGTHSKVTSPLERILGSIITLGGILFFSSILGVTVDMIREKMDSLRQGKSRIIERDHTLILGWTEKTIHIIEELCKANESEGGGIVAVLASTSKEQMELELELQLPPRSRRGTRVIFRSGSPLVVSDLLRVSVHMARAVIILSSTGSADQADADTLRTMLSLRSLYEHMNGHVIAEVRDIDNEPLVKLVGGPKVETLVSHDVIGRLMLMSVRQPGLAKVYEALLGFDGDEFYRSEWPELVGDSFGNIMFRFPDAIPIGVFSSDGVLTLRPSPSLVLNHGDQVIVIAEDNDTYKPGPSREFDAGEPPQQVQRPQDVERILFCGWRRDVRDIIQQLDRIVRKGSEVHIMTHCVPLEKRTSRLLEDGLDVTELRNVMLVHYHGNTSVRRKLEALPIESYSSCMIFADEVFEQDTLHADSHSLATLLLIRDIQSSRGTDASWGQVRVVQKADCEDRALSMVRSITDLTGGRCPIICEVLDPHTQKTIANNRHLSLTSDFCQTNKLIAQVLAMVAEDRFVNLLFDELLGNAGCNMAVVPSSRYCSKGERVSFWALAKRASVLGELLVGYQMRNSIDKTVLNPPNKDKAFLWDRYDLAILRGEVKVSRKDPVRLMVKGFVSQEQRASVRAAVEEGELPDDGALRDDGSYARGCGASERSDSERSHPETIMEESVGRTGSSAGEAVNSTAHSTMDAGSTAGVTHSPRQSHSPHQSHSPRHRVRNPANFRSGDSAARTPTPRRHAAHQAQGRGDLGSLPSRLNGLLESCNDLSVAQREQLAGLFGALSEAIRHPPQAQQQQQQHLHHLQPPSMSSRAASPAISRQGSKESAHAAIVAALHSGPSQLIPDEPDRRPPTPRTAMRLAAAGGQAGASSSGGLALPAGAAAPPPSAAAGSQSMTLTEWRMTASM